MRPLRASLDFLPLRFSIFEKKAAEFYPKALSELINKRNELESRWESLNAEVAAVSLEQGADQWANVLESICYEANQLLVASFTKETAQKLTEYFEVLDGAEKDNLLPQNLAQQKENLDGRWHKLRRDSDLLQEAESSSLVNTPLAPRHQNPGHEKTFSNSSNLTHTTMLSSTFSSPKLPHSKSESTTTDLSLSDDGISFTPTKSHCFTPLAAPMPSSFDLDSDSREETPTNKYKVKIVSVSVPLSKNTTLCSIQNVEEQPVTGRSSLSNHASTSIGESGPRWVIDAAASPGFCPSVATPTTRTVWETATYQPSRIPISSHRSRSRSRSRASSRALSRPPSRFADELVKFEPVKQRKLSVRIGPNANSEVSNFETSTRRPATSLAQRSKSISMKEPTYGKDSRKTTSALDHRHDTFSKSSEPLGLSAPVQRKYSVSMIKSSRPQRQFGSLTRSTLNMNLASAASGSLPIYHQFKSQLPVLSPSKSRSRTREPEPSPLVDDADSILEGPPSPIQPKNSQHAFFRTLPPNETLSMEEVFPPQEKYKLTMSTGRTTKPQYTSTPKSRPRTIVGSKEAISASALKSTSNKPPPTVGRYGLRLKA